MKAIKNLFRLTFLGASMIYFSQANSSFGSTVTVLVGSGGLKFVPATANIVQNDTVNWSWSGSFHSSTSGTVNNGAATPNGLWDSGVNNVPHSFSHTFTSAGTFPYYCSIHFGSGMTGSVIVAAASLPPSITITNPSSGTTLSAPASLTLAASATGSITNVQFLQGTALLANLASAPFSVSINNLVAADYNFSAIASDNSGLSATNSIIVHVINADPIIVNAPEFLPPGNFQFSYTADLGLTYIVQDSVNLIDWNSISTNLATQTTVLFTDLNATNGNAYYRVGLKANP
jgi:plastocyanin